MFNVGAYKQTGITPQATTTNIPHPYEQELPKDYKIIVSRYMDAFYSNILPTRYGDGYIEGYELFFRQKGVGFSPEEEDLPKSVGYLIKTTGERAKFYPRYFDNTNTPSPLGNYYFELEDNENTFVEYHQRIYPKLDNPPKGWSKEMMQKLELKLE